MKLQASGLQFYLKIDSGTGEVCEISKNTFCYSTPPMAASVCCRTASVCCRRKVAAAKIEKLKAVIIKYYDISKTYSVQFQLN